MKSLINIRSPREIECMRRAGAIVAAVLALCKRLAAPGVATQELDEAAEALIRERGGIPLFKGYRGFPGNICASINEEVVHGIPGSRKLCAGDILSVDVGVKLGGYCGDAAVTLPVGDVSDEAERLMQVTRAALERAIATLRPNARLAEVSGAVQTYAESQGCSVVRKYTGHGIGREMHEEPQVPNFFAPSMPNPILPKGTVLAIEPMINAGGSEVEVLRNAWTVVTKDRALSAHFEHTVAIGENGPDVLTVLEE